MRSEGKAVPPVKLENTAFNKFKWLLVIALLVAGIIANSYYGQIAWPLRLLAWLIGLPVVLFLALQTREGKLSWVFIGDARTELRKITWPNRQETLQTTLFIGLMVVIVSIFLWGIDGLLMWLIGWLTGQRG